MPRVRLARRLKVLLISGAVGMACAPGERPPRAPVHGTLAVGRERGGSASDGPFRVVFAAPRGSATSAAELSLVFSRPLRALEVAGAAAVPSIVVTPALAGHWSWVGARGLRFVPDSPRLPGATAYRVEVPGGVRALDGAVLGDPFRFDFETPRPSVVRSEPPAGAEGLDLATTFELELSQPVDPVRFEQGAMLAAERGGKARNIPFSATRPDVRQPKKVLIRPRTPLPKDSAITLSITPRLVGEEGPLPAATAQLAYRTYGPLRVERLDCDTNTPHGGCAPGGTLGLALSNPVRVRDLRRAVSVDPPEGIRLEGGDADDWTQYLSLAGGFQPSRSYTITVAADLVDRHGQALGAAAVRKIAIDDYPARVEIGVTDGTLLPGSTEPIQIGAVNVASYDLSTASLVQDDLVPILSLASSEEKRDALARLPRARRKRVAPLGPKNQVTREGISTRDVLGGNHGVVAIGVRCAAPAQTGSDPFRLVKVTDLALSAKVSRAGTLVWVTRLSTGEPVAGAGVQVLRAAVAASAAVLTDAAGLARIPAGTYAPDLYAEGPDSHALLVVRSKDDWTFERVEDRLPEWRLPVSVDLSGKSHAYGMLFTERGVYRPGDTVRIKGIVRNETPTGNATPSSRPVDVVLRSPDDEEIATVKVVTTRFGTFAADLVVPHSGRLGAWQVRAKGFGEDVLSGGFEVAEYRPAEFRATVEAEVPTHVHGATARFTARGDYLFGAPMSGAQVRYTISRGPTDYRVPGAEGFATEASTFYADRQDAAQTAGEIAALDAKLDAKGVLAFSTRLDLPAQRGPELVRVDAEVTDISRQAIGASTSVLVHPADFYVGLRVPEDVFVDAPGTLSPAVVVLSPDGKRLGGKKVKVELVQRRWTLAREVLASGASHAVTKVVDRTVGGCELTTAEAPAPCALAVKESGYYVVVARAKDGRGNLAEAAFGAYATGSGGAAWGDDDRALVELVPNKKQYRAGETARILVKSPFAEAQALVTVERAGVYRAERVTLRGPSPTVSVPITDELRPNAFVSVHLLRGTKGKGAGDARYRVGYAELTLDPEARRLSVDVKPNRTELRPGEEVSIELGVRGGGKPVPAEVTIYAVDEGVLMLTGYRTPDPLPVFTAPRPLQVATIETRALLAKISLDAFDGALGAQKGAEGGGGGEGARRDFRQTAYFNPSVLTDAAGRATVKFKLPDGLTTYRVMAVATTEGDRYGYGAASVVASRRLMARPNLPRFLRAGDRMEAGVIVTSKGLPAGPVTVRAAAKGLSLDGQSERVIELARDASVEVRFPFHAETASDATLRFDVAAAGERDAVVVTRRVQVPGALETVALYGSTEQASAERLGDLSLIRHDAGGLELTLASSALVGLDAGAAQLVDYPFGCTEQLSSRLLPLLPLRELSRAFGFALPVDADAVAARGVAEILARQRGDGGFGLWPESPSSTPWVSAYATWVLELAAREGARVPRRARDRARDYLRRYLAEPDGDPTRLATAAFIVDVLAEAGAPDPGYAGRLFEQRQALPLFASAFLLHALAVGKGPKAAVETLFTEVTSQLRITNDSAFVAENVGDAYAVLLDSPARTGALVLRALLAVDARHPLGSALARGLVSQRSGGTWRTTQETAYALLALDAYRRSTEAEAPSFTAKVWLGDRLLRTAPFAGKLTADHSLLALARLPAGGAGTLVFQKQGPGTLHYEARLRYVRRTLPATPVDEGFFVQKALRALTPVELKDALETVPGTGTTRFRAGDLVLADLVVVTPSPRDYVVIEDALPAGLEGVDSGLATTAAWLDVEGSTRTAAEACDGCESPRDAQAHGRAFQDAWYRREVRDDRVLFFVDHMAAGMYHYRYLARATTPGTFVAPGARAEEMYTPETFGRTGAETVVVQ